MPLNHAPGNAAPAMTRVLQGVNVDIFLLAFNYDLNHRDGLDEAIPLAEKALDLARAQGATSLAKELEADLAYLRAQRSTP